jgi:hypothetical protein
VSAGPHICLCRPAPRPPHPRHPACVRRYVRDLNRDDTPEEALSDFLRFPLWMWRNTAVRDFLTWLRAHNDEARRRAFLVSGPGAPAPPPDGQPLARQREMRAAAGQAGFYGMDVYSLHASAHRVLDFLRQVDPEAAARAAARYRCAAAKGQGPGGLGGGCFVSGGCFVVLHNEALGDSIGALLRHPPLAPPPSPPPAGVSTSTARTPWPTAWPRAWPGSRPARGPPPRSCATCCATGPTTPSATTAR